MAAVGRLRRGPEADLTQRYRDQIHWPVDIREIEEKRPLPTAEKRVSEAALLLRAVPAGAAAIALDERGKSLSSEELAGRFRRWQDSGRDIAFLIGGAGGLDRAVKDASELLLAFGRATWPHRLARVMLFEQIYRVQQIMAGHPYHKS